VRGFRCDRRCEACCGCRCRCRREDFIDSEGGDGGYAEVEAEAVSMSDLHNDLAAVQAVVQSSLDAVRKPKTPFLYYQSQWKRDVDQTKYHKMAQVDKERYDVEIRDAEQPIRQEVLKMKLHVRTKTSSGLHFVNYNVSKQVEHLDFNSNVATLIDGTCVAGISGLELMTNYTGHIGKYTQHTSGKITTY